jgi:hypothetical protein
MLSFCFVVLYKQESTVRKVLQKHASVTTLRILLLEELAARSECAEIR